MSPVVSTLARLRALHDLDFELMTYPERKVHLDPKRQALLLEIPPPYRSLYERIRAAKGTALATVKGNTCVGCNMHLPPQLINEIRKTQTIHQCPTCKRILSPDLES